MSEPIRTAKAMTVQELIVELQTLMPAYADKVVKFIDIYGGDMFSEHTVRKVGSDHENVLLNNDDS